tara:strand:+ start:8350 stop:8529 length:180 start_codon:yes stop_codon:yes gene_type:complete
MDTQNEIIEQLTRYYELDLDNCCMSHDMWIKELAKAIDNPSKYAEDLKKELKEYDDDRR